MGEQQEANENSVLMGGHTKAKKDVDYGHPASEGHNENSLQFAGVLLVCQIIFMILFGVFVRYNENGIDESMDRTYPWFQDTHVMIVVGFGFLMTFLKRYGWSSVGFNFLFTGFTIQWSLLVTGFFHDILHHFTDATHDANSTMHIQLNMDRMLEADFTTGAILISFGAVLGVASPVQLLFMILFEVVFYNLNALVVVSYIEAMDIGGSMVIHAFGAYFGLAVARVLYKPNGQMDNAAEGAEYHSDMFSMIGTVFLWMFWPSFNSAPGNDVDRYYAICNTYLALSAACVSTFIFSILFNPKRRITMEHIQNATLAGGVAMGTAANMQVEPAGALFIGFSAGLLSTAGYSYIKPFLAEKVSLHDTCGVNNLHGMPAIMAAIFSIIHCAVNNHAQMMPQVYALVATLGTALAAGTLTGCFLRLPAVEHLGEYEYFEDGKYWEIEEDEEKED